MPILRAMISNSDTSVPSRSTSITTLACKSKVTRTVRGQHASPTRYSRIIESITTLIAEGTRESHPNVHDEDCRLFRLCNSQSVWNETWLEQVHKILNQFVYFFGLLENKYGHPGFWLAETFFNFPAII